MNNPIRVGLLLHPAFELLDAFGPIEMYSILGKDRAEIVTIAENAVHLGGSRNTNKHTRPGQ